MTRHSRREQWNVLLAEDNDSHAMLIQMALEGAASVPMDVHRARDGDEAIAMIGSLVPDLVLLDLDMPGRTGHEVLEAVKGDDELRHVPITVLTCSDREKDISRSYGLGSNHYITKVNDPAELKRRLHTLLKNVDELLPIRRGSGGRRQASAQLVPVGHANLRWVALSSVIVFFLMVFAYVLDVL